MLKSYFSHLRYKVHVAKYMWFISYILYMVYTLIIFYIWFYRFAYFFDILLFILLHFYIILYATCLYITVIICRTVIALYYQKESTVLYYRNDNVLDEHMIITTMNYIHECSSSVLMSWAKYDITLDEYSVLFCVDWYDAC